MSKIANGSTLQTRGVDGTVLHWAVCGGCGFIDEVSENRAAVWHRAPYCRSCEEEAIAQAEWGLAALGCADSDIV